MSTKVKIIGAAIIVILLNIMFFSTTGMISVMNGTGGTKSSLNSVSSLKELHKSVSYDFDIPQFLLNEENVKYQVIANTNIQIDNSRFKFCVAPYIADNVSIVGDYNDYEFDKYYEYDENIRLLHYRTDGTTTIVEWFTDDVAYGLCMMNYDGFNGMDALIEGIGLDSGKLIEKSDILDDTGVDSSNTESESS